jgi:molybdopterin converting factor small subunit
LKINYPEIIYRLIPMQINVKLSTNFRKWCVAEGAILTAEKDGDKLELEVEGGTTVHKLFGMIGIPDEIERSFFVNGRHAELNTQLNEGDILLVLPLFGGG